MVDDTQRAVQQPANVRFLAPLGMTIHAGAMWASLGLADCFNFGWNGLILCDCGTR
jgi:hypothetical protein